MKIKSLDFRCRDTDDYRLCKEGPHPALLSEALKVVNIKVKNCLRTKGLFLVLWLLISLILRG